MTDQGPSRFLDKIIIRLPDGMKERIRKVAEAHGRSVNAELRMLFERTYQPEAKLDEYVSEIDSFIRNMPAQDQDTLWKSVLEKLDTARRK